MSGIKKINLVVLFGCLYIFDRLIKLWILKTDARLGSSVFFMQLSRNTTGAFNLPLSKWWLVGLGLVGIFILIVIGYKLYNKQNYQTLVGVIFMLTGGLSNVWDRLMGGVIDIFYLPIGLSFNLSDVYLIVGLGVFIYSNLNKKTI